MNKNKSTTAKIWYQLFLSQPNEYNYLRSDFMSIKNDKLKLLIIGGSGKGLKLHVELMIHI